MSRADRRKAIKCRHPEDGSDWCSNCIAPMWKVPSLCNNGKNVFNIGFFETNRPADYPKPDYKLVGKPIPIDNELYEQQN